MDVHGGASLHVADALAGMKMLLTAEETADSYGAALFGQYLGAHGDAFLADADAVRACNQATATIRPLPTEGTDEVLRAVLTSHDDAQPIRHQRKLAAPCPSQRGVRPARWQCC